MAKHIIDTTSPEFSGLPMRLRQSHKGMILLSEDRGSDGSLRGIVTMDIELLGKKPIDIFSAEQLIDLPIQYHNRPYIEYLADDANGVNNSGHRKHAQVHEEVLDEPELIAKLQANGVTLPEIAQLKGKFRNARAIGVEVV